jgi:hypothetical protein
MNLATAYNGRLSGSKADNVDTAIAFYESSLEVYTRETLNLVLAHKRVHTREALSSLEMWARTKVRFIRAEGGRQYF